MKKLRGGRKYARPREEKSPGKRSVFGIQRDSRVSGGNNKKGGRGNSCLRRVETPSARTRDRILASRGPHFFARAKREDEEETECNLAENRRDNHRLESVGLRARPAKKTGIGRLPDPRKGGRWMTKLAKKTSIHQIDIEGHDSALARGGAGAEAA